MDNNDLKERDFEVYIEHWLTTEGGYTKGNQATDDNAVVEIRSVSKKAFRKDKNKKWKNWKRGSNGTCTSKNPFVRMIYTPMING